VQKIAVNLTKMSLAIPGLVDHASRAACTSLPMDKLEREITRDAQAAALEATFLGAGAFALLAGKGQTERDGGIVGFREGASPPTACLRVFGRGSMR